MLILPVMNPCPVIWADNPSIKIVLSFTNDYKMDKPYKSTLQRGISSTVSLLRSFRGVFLLLFFSQLLFFPVLSNLYFAAALDDRFLQFPFLKRLTLYWWQAWGRHCSWGNTITTSTWVKLGRVTSGNWISKDEGYYDVVIRCIVYFYCPCTLFRTGGVSRSRIDNMLGVYLFKAQEAAVVVPSIVPIDQYSRFETALVIPS